MPISSRSWRRRALGLIAGSLLASLLAGEVKAQRTPQPGSPPAPFVPQPAIAPQPSLPLLYVRIGGPKGMKATFFRGAQKGQTVATPCVVGLRPGYLYRIALSEIPAHPGRYFFPSLEVRASLMLGHRLRSAEFPAALNFTDEDFTRAGAGALIRKVIVLERPDQAEPTATRADAPLEIRVPPGGDPIVAARERGQPLVLVHMGQRDLTTDELAYSGASGTVLMPGEKVLAPPRVPPSGPWGCFPVVDPMNGPINPEAWCNLPDGGDVGLPAGFGPDGKLRGLDPSDTVAEYVDSKGRKRLAISNRVCLCVPRFVITRGETLPSTEVALVALGRSHRFNQHDVVAGRQALVTEAQKQMLETIGQKQRPSGTSNLYGTAVVGRVRGVEIKVALRAVEEVNGVCLRPAEQAPADLPLLIIKWPDKAGALIGEVVTFFLRFTNQGGQPITDVVVSDSLTPRFEYVAGSAKTDREAIFTIQPNEGGSAVLRWQFNGVLPPHETGTVSFQVRVR